MKIMSKNVQKKCIFYLVKMKIFGILSRVVSRAIYESRKSQKKVFIFPDFDMNGHLPCGNRCTNFWDTPYIKDAKSDKKDDALKSFGARAFSARARSEYSII